MRTTLFKFIFVLWAFNPCYAQETGKTFHFTEVGWTLILPSDFKIMDSAGSARLNNRGKKAMEEANNVTVDASATRDLIMANKAPSNYFNATITPFNPAVDGDYKTANQSVKEMMFTTFIQKMPDAKIDSSSASVSIDGLRFDQYHVSVFIKDKLNMNLYLLSKLYKGYDFSISYLYLDEKTKEQIGSILKGSKFSR